MDNYRNTNTARRYKAHVSIWGTSQLHLRNPYIIGWWSAAFPGLGHFFLSKYLRGSILFIWEVVINIMAHVNEAMIYSFQGKIDQAKEVLDTQWLLIYIPVYLFTIWDGYRTTVDLNHVYLLAEHENHTYNTFSIGALEINYLDKRTPSTAVLCSLFMPGLGHLYLHRIVPSFFVIIWTITFFYYSHILEGVSFLFLGHVKQSTAVLNGEWLLFLPSVYGFSIYNSYVNTVENNKLFEDEQRTFLKTNYQNRNFIIQKGKK